MFGLQRQTSALLALGLLVATPLVSAYTNVKVTVGTGVATISTTDKNGNGEQLTQPTTYTSLLVIMNDGGQASTLVGTLVTTTYNDGKTATLTMPVIPSTLPTLTPLSTPTPGPGSAQATETAAASSKSSTNVGAIAGGAAGGVIVLIILGVFGYFHYRKRSRRRQLEEHQKEEMQLLALELGGSFNPNRPKDNHFSEDGGVFMNPKSNGSITDDLASRYTGGSLAQNPPTLHETYSNATYHISVGTELTMDSQGRHGLPDGSPLVVDSILPMRNVKAADNYTDLEWFPLMTSESQLQPHPGPNYVEDRGLSNIATFIQKSSTQKVLSPISMLNR